MSDDVTTEFRRMGAGERAAVVIRTGHPARDDGSHCVMILAEKEDGTPMGYVGTAADGGHLYDVGNRDSYGFILATGWRDADSLRARFPDLRISGRQDVALAEAAWRVGGEEMLEAGFSAAFVEMLDAMSGWHPVHALNLDAFRRFCGDGETARALRAFVVRAPLLAHFHALAAADFAGREGRLPPDFPGGLSTARARAFEGRRWSLKVARVDARSVDDLLDGHACRTLEKMIAAVPLDWIPSDPAGIEAFWKATAMLSVHADLGVPPMDLAASCAGDWPAFVARCEAAAPRNVWLPDYYGTSDYITDPADDLAYKVLLPLMAGAGGILGDMDESEAEELAEKVSRRLMYRDMGLPGVVRTAAAWHDRVAAVHRAMPSDADVLGYEWPALLPPATVNGIAMRCLLTGADLLAEGADGADDFGLAGLDHCVGSYRAKAHSGLCHIVGLRDAATGRRLATAELAQGRDGQVEVRQLRGARNAPAPAGCKEALATYVRGPVPYLPPRKPPEDNVRERCGYDWTDPALVRQAVEAYAPFLPRGLRGDPEAILREIEGGLENVVEGPSP